MRTFALGSSLQALFVDCSSFAERLYFTFEHAIAKIANVALPAISRVNVKVYSAGIAAVTPSRIIPPALFHTVITKPPISSCSG